MTMPGPRSASSAPTPAKWASRCAASASSRAIDNLDAALADLRRWNRYPRAILFLDEPGRLKGLTADQLGLLKNDGIRLLRLPSIVELSQHDGMALLPMREISVEELAGPRADRARPRRRPRPDPGPPRPDHRRRRLHRRRAVPSGGRLRGRPHHHAGLLRDLAVRDRPRAWRDLPRPVAQGGPGRRAQRRPRRRLLPPRKAGPGVPRRGAQACVHGRAPSLRGRADQCHRHLERGRGRPGLRRRPDGADLHRQGGRPVQCHGRHQAPGRIGDPGPAERLGHPVLGRAVRQRAGFGRFGGADLQVADRPRRPGHRDP